MDSEIEALLNLPLLIEQNMGIVWTFILLSTRYFALMATLPGIGMGASGTAVRGPAILILAGVSCITSQVAPVPVHWGEIVLQLVSEVMLGALLGLIPFMIVAAVQTGAQTASTAMGLNAGNVIDPSLGQMSSDLGRILGDFTILLFLILGGHHAVIYTAAGLGGTIVPGTYLVGDASMGLLVDQSAKVLESSIMIAAPVLVALLLTNFVMGMISKAVPTVNIFIVSFPLTIGIGLILILVSLRDIGVYIERQINTIETQILVAVQDTLIRPPASFSRSPPP